MGDIIHTILPSVAIEGNHTPITPQSFSNFEQSSQSDLLGGKGQQDTWPPSLSLSLPSGCHHCQATAVLSPARVEAEPSFPGSHLKLTSRRSKDWGMTKEMCVGIHTG